MNLADRDPGAIATERTVHRQRQDSRDPHQKAVRAAVGVRHYLIDLGLEEEDDRVRGDDIHEREEQDEDALVPPPRSVQAQHRSRCSNVTRSSQRDA